METISAARTASTAVVVTLAEDGAAARDCLTALERDLHDGLPGLERQHDFRAGRLAAKVAVASVLGLADGESVGQIEIGREVVGAPVARIVRPAVGPLPLPVAVSLAHRDGRAAAAAGPASLCVGIDLERADALTPWHARYALTPAERAHAAGDGCAKLWVLKEAAWKALRLARDVPFSALELELDGDGDLYGIRLWGEQRPACGTVFSPWRGYVLAVVWGPGVAGPTAVSRPTALDVWRAA